MGFILVEQGFAKIHDERKLTKCEIAFMYVDPSIVDGLVRGLRTFYYVLNNLFFQTIKPKIGSTSNLYGYARNMLQGSNMMENPSQFLN